MGKNNSKIGSVVRIRQMVKQWQKKAHIGIGSNNNNKEEPVPDVPPGHVAVTVGENRRRYVVRAKNLNHPIFRRLLAEAEEEYGFSNVGPLAIPCDESSFEEIVRVVTRSEAWGRGGTATLEDIRRCSHVGMARKVEYLGESRPLLPGVGEKSIC